ncbi:Minf_1886 family protein [Zavarzinella formosa]|uniref:Minf_1886 family protein n=1 Tax=Zavarzinella formosa TaxID=360055 RepID=UPI0002DA5402|nr:Minf_1886 family protein [Zavarzinella formosa]
MRHPEIAEIVRRDRRYAYEAYEFIFDALGHTQQMVGRKPREGEPLAEEHHVSGAEILRGTVDLARKEFGFLAKTVFHQWGVTRTDDIGELVFNLIEGSLLSKTETDRRADFQNLFDLDRALTDDFAISLNEAPPIRRGHR